MGLSRFIPSSTAFEAEVLRITALTPTPAPRLLVQAIIRKLLHRTEINHQYRLQGWLVRSYNSSGTVSRPAQIKTRQICSKTKTHSYHIAITVCALNERSKLWVETAAVKQNHPYKAADSTLPTMHPDRFGNRKSVCFVRD